MSEAKLNNLKTENLDITNLSLGTSNDDADTKKKAKKVLMSELEQLMDVMTQVEDSKSGTTKSDLKKMLEKVLSGSKDLDLSDVLEAIKSVIKKDGGNIASLAKLIQDMMKDTPGAKQAKKELKFAEKMMKDVMKAVEDGETTLEEIVGNKDFQAFLGALTGGDSATSSQTQSASSSAPKEPKSETHREALMNIAVALQKLLSTVYECQTSSGDLYSDALKAQLQSIQATTEQKIKDMKNEQSEQTKAGTKPWYMYLIAAVVAVVGAVVAFFTAGAAAAVVGLVIAGIMMSPIGDDLTAALVKMFLGNNTDPTDAQKTGAQIGATVLVTILVTLLSMGASGVTSAADGVADGAADAVDTAASASSGLGNDLADADNMMMEMTEMGDNAGATMARQMQEEEEDMTAAIEDVEDAADGSDDDSSTTSTKSIGTKFKEAFKNIHFDKKALTTGLAKRLIGNLIIGFLGSGGLTEIMELIAETNPDLKKDLDSTLGAVIMTIISALVAIGGSVGASKLLVEPGVGERADYLDYSGKEDTSLELSKTASTVLDSISLLAGVANGAVGVVKYTQYDQVAAMKKLVAAIEALLVTQTSSFEGLDATQSDMNKGYSKDASNLSSVLKAVFDVLGNDQLKTAKSMA